MESYLRKLCTHLFINSFSLYMHNEDLIICVASSVIASILQWLNRRWRHVADIGNMRCEQIPPPSETPRKMCGPGELSRYGDSVRAGRSGDRIPVGGEIYHTRPDWPWGSPSLLYNGYRVCFPGVKRPGRGIDHPSPLSVEAKVRVELYIFSPSGPSWPVRGWAWPLRWMGVKC